MPKICLKGALDMLDKYLRYAWEMFEIFLTHALFMPNIYGQDKVEKYLIYTWDMPEIRLRNA